MKLLSWILNSELAERLFSPTKTLAVNLTVGGVITWAQLEPFLKGSLLVLSILLTIVTLLIKSSEYWQILKIWWSRRKS